MNDSLKATFSKELISLAATIGEKSDPVEDKVQQLFGNLPDPLISDTDVRVLLGGHIPLEDIKVAIRSLVEKGVLESSNLTLRPLDEEGTVVYRLVNVPFARLKLIAMEAQLSDGSTRYQLTCDGRIIRSIARVDRLDALAAEGNQRQEIRSHVEEIAKGIKEGTQVPNAVLLVLMDSQVTESPTDETPESFIVARPLVDWVTVNLPNEADSPVQKFRSVELDFPYRRAAFDEEKSALLVDGQQRTAVLSLVDIDEVPTFSLSVNALKATAEQAKRVFQVANSTVKISTEFSRALLASMSDAPVYLRKERAKALAVKKLALGLEDSPFFGLAQHPGVRQSPRPPIAYNSLFQVVRAFEESPLPLEDADVLTETVAKSYTLVKKTWPEAWGKKPADSKLMHGGGLRAMAAVIASKLAALVAESTGDVKEPAVWQRLEESLQRLKTRIIWTHEEAGQASTAVRKIWTDEIVSRQNTNQDIQALINFLSKEMLKLDVDAKKPAKGTK